MIENHKILVFAGTTEGREIAEFLSEHKINAYISTATTYGASLLPNEECIETQGQPINQQEMVELIKKEKITFVIDGTHPFAVVVSKNIKKACQETNITYIRLLRLALQKGQEDLLYVESVAEAVSYLKDTMGNIFVTTGSKELEQYTQIDDYKNRVYARVLSTSSVVAYCSTLGFEGRNLICMQGPFSAELNYAMLKQTGATYLVTKESGKAGGFEEKIEAAKRSGVKTIVIGRPVEEEGLSTEEVKKYILNKLNIKRKQKITLIGIGMGHKNTMTIEAKEEIEKAQVLIGAKRMIESLDTQGKTVFISYKPEEIRAYIDTCQDFEQIAILFSGDIGFYSGAKKLQLILQDKQVNVISGISAPIYFSGKLGIPWENLYFTSLHGRNNNIVGIVKQNKYVFSLLEKGSMKELCEQLIEFGLDCVTLWVGENLSYENEKIIEGTPAAFLEKEFEPLSVVLIENKNVSNASFISGIKEEAYIRGQVPMTKEEVRSISLAKLGLQKDSIIYDIGAGTGSVAIEMALNAVQGNVFAIEQKAAAVCLIKENKRKFGVSNLEVIEATAPEGMVSFPPATHVFIGGSTGKLNEIVKLTLEKNSNARIVINAIALETLTEALKCIKTYPVHNVDIVSVTIGKTKEVANYHMMMGNNPVYIISFTGGNEHENS